MQQPIILPYNGIYPKIHPTAFIAPGAVIVGDVEIGAETNVWFGCVIRGDVNTIRIGERTNIQDGTVIHVTRGTGPTTIGSDITIGHKALLHACTLEDACFIGMGSILLDFAVVETGGMLAAGSQLTPKKRVPKGQLWAGNPAKFFREMTPQESAFIYESAKNYVINGQEYRILTAAS
ncbi:MAG: gamma carbonic anhydrase family protein [Alphaproteobacteria bacterium]|nr:gamma carbonic anhydrase family protein [Alphaproteobacteria bacterium]